MLFNFTEQLKPLTMSGITFILLKTASRQPPVARCQPLCLLITYNFINAYSPIRYHKRALSDDFCKNEDPTFEAETRGYPGGAAYRRGTASECAKKFQGTRFQRSGSITCSRKCTSGSDSEIGRLATGYWQLA